MLWALAFAIVWMAALLLKIDTMIDRLGLSRFLMLAAVLLVVIVTATTKIIYMMPKCPHCGTRLVGALLSIAVATGNCGHCGRSIED